MKLGVFVLSTIACICAKSLYAHQYDPTGYNRAFEFIAELHGQHDHYCVPIVVSHRHITEECPALDLPEVPPDVRDAAGIGAGIAEMVFCAECGILAPVVFVDGAIRCYDCARAIMERHSEEAKKEAEK
jgi:hypothetical protein